MKVIELTNNLRRSSFSQDFGTIYRYNNHIYRTIEDKYKEQVKGFLSNEYMMKRLHEYGLIETTVAPVYTDKYDFILEHKLIDFDSHMNEWSIPAKIDAALMIINLLEELVINGWCLWDGHPFNVLFDYTKPKWIDFHSILPFTLNTCWMNEFKYYIFDKIAINKSFWEASLYGLSTNNKKILLTFLNKIRKYILNININPIKTPWYDYPRLSNTNLDDKQISTLKVMEIVKPFCNTFLDIGCNTGWYSIEATHMGFKVVATDVDEACIADLYLEARKSNSKILPLVSDFKTCLDIINPTHSCFADRLKCDVTLSLALLHHLVFFQHVDFSFIAKRLNILSNKAAIVQFITREDSYVKHWINTTKNINYDWYTMDNFIKEMMKYFKEYEIFESSPKGRKLILFKK